MLKPLFMLLITSTFSVTSLNAGKFPENEEDKTEQHLQAQGHYEVQDDEDDLYEFYQEADGNGNYQAVLPLYEANSLQDMTQEELSAFMRCDEKIDWSQFDHVVHKKDTTPLSMTLGDIQTSLSIFESYTFEDLFASIPQIKETLPQPSENMPQQIKKKYKCLENSPTKSPKKSPLSPCNFNKEITD